MVWLYVPDTAVWNSPSDLCSETISGLSVTARGIPCKPQSLQRAWKTARSITRLSGLTLQPLTAQHGVDRWISSLRDSHANRSASPASDRESKTNAGFGRTSPELLARYDRDSSTWKTFPDLFGTVLDLSPEAWPKSGSMRNGILSPLPKSARRISGNGFFFWHTPRAIYGAGHAGMESPTHLTGQALEWPTPDAGAQRRHNTSPGPAGPRPTLALLVEGWATPRGEGAERSGAHRGTPDTLTSQADMWQTPATDSFRSRGGDRKDEPGLDQQARFWSTPLGREWKDTAGANVPENGILAREVFNDHATAPHSRQHETTARGGPRTSAPVVLNPRFVEALMGLPDGMTDYSAPVTGLSLWRRRMRSLLWRIVSD